MVPSQNNGDGSLDPQEWPALRDLGHRMLDDMFDYLETIRERPVWQPMPDEVRARFRGRLPLASTELSAVHQEFLEDVVPYSNGNVHPGFMGWVQGGGTAPGMLAEMLAAGLNANLGGRDHGGIAVERQVVEWVRALFGFPESASGLFVTGTSMANFLAVLIARAKALGANVRRSGVGGSTLRGYTSTAVHGCVRRAFDYAGLGSDAL